MPFSHLHAQWHVSEIQLIGPFSYLDMLINISWALYHYCDKLSFVQLILPELLDIILTILGKLLYLFLHMKKIFQSTILMYISLRFANLFQYEAWIAPETGHAFPTITKRVTIVLYWFIGPTATFLWCLECIFSPFGLNFGHAI